MTTPGLSPLETAVRARRELLRIATSVLAHDLTPEALDRPARDLAAAVDDLPERHQPDGWAGR
jgi:hypothetical protein